MTKIGNVILNSNWMLNENTPTIIDMSFVDCDTPNFDKNILLHPEKILFLTDPYRFLLNGISLYGPVTDKDTNKILGIVISWNGYISDVEYSDSFVRDIFYMDCLIVPPKSSIGVLYTLD